MVRYEDNENSDLDILIQFNEDKSLFDLIGLKLELEENNNLRFIKFKNQRANIIGTRNYLCIKTLKYF